MCFVLGVVMVDVVIGFVYLVIELGMDLLVQVVQEIGIVILFVVNFYVCGFLGYFIEELVDYGFVVFMMVNVLFIIVFFGGRIFFFGMNLIFFVVFCVGIVFLVIDQFLSVVVMVLVIKVYQCGDVLLLGWVLDRDGKFMIFLVEVMQGSFVVIGGYKGIGFVLMVDLLLVGFSGLYFLYEVLLFGDCDGGLFWMG